MSRAWASTASLSGGLRYERKVGRALLELFPFPSRVLHQYPCGHGFVDHYIIRPDAPNILVECKATFTLDALAQIARYAAHVSCPCIRAIICQRGGGCRTPSGVEFAPALSTLALSSLGTSLTYVIPWTGRFGIT